jgi:hypothetical protein
MWILDYCCHRVPTHYESLSWFERSFTINHGCYCLTIMSSVSYIYLLTWAALVWRGPLATPTWYSGMARRPKHSGTGLLCPMSLASDITQKTDWETQLPNDIKYISTRTNNLVSAKAKVEDHQLSSLVFLNGSSVLNCYSNIHLG